MAGGVSEREGWGGLVAVAKGQRGFVKGQRKRVRTAGGREPGAGCRNLFAAGPGGSDRLWVSLLWTGRLSGTSIVLLPLRYWPVSGLFGFQNFRIGALEDDLATGGAVARAEIDDLVGGAHDAGLVFDHDHGIPGRRGVE